MKKTLFAALAAMVAVSCGRTLDGVLKEGETFTFPSKYSDFVMTGKLRMSENAEGTIHFSRTDESHGYEVLLCNGAIDGTRKTGSLSHVRNLYRSLAKDNEWFDFTLCVNSGTVNVKVNGADVVLYTQPENPWRSPENAGQILSEGKIGISCLTGSIEISAMSVSADNIPALPEGMMPPVDEQNDQIIRLQQADFPVIDYHVHLKGGLTKEMAHAMSMNYGINYGVSPNAGEGGVGRMLANDKEVYEYYDELKDAPFLFGVQGEGRRWTQVFSPEALGIFEYLFTDAMTIIDHKGRNSRIYRAEEVKYDGITRQAYMDHLVDQIVLILTNEPADIYANATFIPDDMNRDYAMYWTEKRIDRVLDVLAKYGIALEINPRYRIPSLHIIKEAKARGIKFTFGTNNTDANLGKLEYCIKAIEKCGLTADDIWFPAYSTRRDRPTVIYNHFDK